VQQQQEKQLVLENEMQKQKLRPQRKQQLRESDVQQLRKEQLRESEQLLEKVVQNAELQLRKVELRDASLPLEKVEQNVKLLREKAALNVKRPRKAELNADVDNNSTLISLFSNYTYP
jgi:hypothetical protein